MDVVVVGGEEGGGYCEMVDGEECVGEAPCRNGLGSHRAKYSSVYIVGLEWGIRGGLGFHWESPFQAKVEAYRP